MRAFIRTAVVFTLVISAGVTAPSGSASSTRARVTALGWIPAAVVVDAYGDAFVTGYQGRAMVVAKLGPGGRVIWMRHWWPPAKDRSNGQDIALAPDGGVYVVGSVSLSHYEGGSAFLRRYGPNGGLRWMRASPHWQTRPHAVTYSAAAASMDLVVVAMNRYGCCAEAADDGFVRGYAPDGRRLWTRAFETKRITGTNDRLSDVAIGSGDDVFLAGQIEMEPRSDSADYVDLGTLVQKMTPAGRLSWERFQGRGPLDADGATAISVRGAGVMVAGRAGITRHAPGEATLSRISNSGVVSWTKAWGAGKGPTVYALASHGDDRLYAAGSMGSNAFLRAYTADGSIVVGWSTRGWQSARATGVGVGSSGIWVVGSRSGSYGNEKGTIWRWPA